jgi:hypothetical protein
MIKRIAQRTNEDCAICAVAMVMGHPYNYERVLKDSDKYDKVYVAGKYYSWWYPYLRDEGFEIVYRQFLDLFDIPQSAGRIVGLLTMDIPHIKWAHIVAIDELGVIDPAGNAPDHIEIHEYICCRKSEGVNFHNEFLAVKIRYLKCGSDK